MQFVLASISCQSAMSKVKEFLGAPDAREGKDKEGIKRSLGKEGKVSFLENIPKGSPPNFFSELGQEARKMIHGGFQHGSSVSVTGITPLNTMLTSVTSQMDNLALIMASVVITPVKGMLLDISTASSGKVQTSASWKKELGLSGTISSQFPCDMTGQAGLAYRHQHFTVQALSALHPKPPLELNATFGGLRHNLTLGVDSGVDPWASKLWKLNAALCIQEKNASASAVFDFLHRRLVDVILMQAIDPKLSVAIQSCSNVDNGEHARFYCVQYMPHSKWNLKGRFGNAGIAEGLLQYEFSPSSTIGLQTKWDTTLRGLKALKAGLTLNIMPVT